MLIMQNKYLVNDLHVQNTSKSKLWFKALNNFATGILPNDCIWIQASDFCEARHVQAETGVDSNRNTGYSTNNKKLPAQCVGYSKVAWSLRTSASHNPEHPSMTQPAGEVMWQPARCTHTFAQLRKVIFVIYLAYLEVVHTLVSKMSLEEPCLSNWIKPNILMNVCLWKFFFCTV